MIALVVPITRIRHASVSWSYQVPTGMVVYPGSMVRIKFNSRELSGIVWSTKDADPLAKESLLSVVHPLPIIRTKERQLIEWLSLAGCLSLSTATYLWLPSCLRAPKLRPSVQQKLLTELQAPDPLLRQELIMVPERRPKLELYLARKYGSDLANTFQAESDLIELQTWIKIYNGQAKCVVGRERAVFAPFANLRQVTVLNPEDLSYHPGQAPYISMVETAQTVSKQYGAKSRLLTYLPQIPAEQLFGPAAEGAAPKPCQTVLIDLNRTKVINPEMVKLILSTVQAQQSVLLLLNAKDQRIKLDNGEQKQILALETFSQQLKEQIPPSLQPQLQIGTRKILREPEPASLGVILDLGPELRASHLAGLVQSIANLERMRSLAPKIIVQTKQLLHPLLSALLHGQLSNYLETALQERQANHLPPYSTLYLALHKLEPEAMLLHQSLNQIMASHPSNWQLGHPLGLNYEKQLYFAVSLYNQDLHDPLLPTPIYKLLSNLQRPWKITRNPWYYL